MSTGVFHKTASNVIEEALRLATITGIQMPVNGEDFARGWERLNSLLAAWQANQIHIWSETEAFMPLNPLQSKYIFGTDHAFTDYQYTTVKAAALSGASSLDVATTSGFNAGDFIGIELSTGVRQWLTINAVTDSDTVTLVGTLNASVAIGATVYVYTTKIDLPVRILDVRYSDSYLADELPTWSISRQEYYNQTSKSAQGAINQWYYSRQLANPYLNVWPTAQSCNNVLRFTFIKPQYIPEDQSENVLIPPEWFNALTWGLARDLGMVYNIDPNRQLMLAQQAQSYFDTALSSDTDYSPVLFQPSGLWQE